MKISDLRKIGLSQTEAALYLTLVKLGSSDVQKLIEETGFYKSNAYDALERLCEKGIISKIIDNTKRVYQLQKPESLIEYIKKKRQLIEEQEALAKKLSMEVDFSKKHIDSKETASVFIGLSGVKQIYSEIIAKKLDYLVFGSPKESETLIGDYYWKNLHQKQKEHKIKARMIFHKSLRHWKETIPTKQIELRFLDEKFEPLTETTIYGNKVALVVWSDKPVVTIIENKHAANSYRQVFELLWKISKK